MLQEICRECSVSDLENCTIGEMVLLRRAAERRGIKFVGMDQGSPSLPINRIGVKAEQEALEKGFGNTYPAAEGIEPLKKAASRFVKAFLDIDVSPRSCLPTTGSAAGSFVSFAACTQRIPGKDKVLFIDPGFPIQKSQLKILGTGWKSFDIYNYRGAAALEPKLREMLAEGDVAAIVYSNPNNPAWICLNEEELEVVGRLATEYDAVVTEDLAYFGMDNRKDLSHPFEAPFVPTVARYTDNWILMMTSSKIFSYAGQRIGFIAISDKLYEKQYPALAQRYNDSGVFGVTLIASIAYMVTSGCTTSTQYGYARMLEASCEGEIKFLEDTRAYPERARAMKDIFLSHGFHLVYDSDPGAPIGDGFFFSIGYGSLPGGELLREMYCYGMSSINMRSTGSLRDGVRVCVSPVTEEMLPLLEERAAMFEKDHEI